MFEKILRRCSGAIAMCLLAVGVTSAPVKVGAETLADAMAGAYNTSGLLDQNRALLRAADEDVAIAVSALRPVIDWTASVSADWADTQRGIISTNSTTYPAFVGLQLDMLLYDGGASQLAIEAAKQTVLATRQTLISIEQVVMIRAVAAYMNVILQQENVALRENNVRLLSEELRATQDRFDVGEVTRTDVALAESRLAASRSNLASARGLLVNARAEYVNVVGREPGDLVSRPRLPTPPSSLDAAVSVAVRNHPDILSAQFQVASADLQIQQAEKAKGIQAGLSANLGLAETLNNDDSNYAASIGINARQNIYSGGRISAQIRRAQAGRDAARGSLLTVRKDIIQSVEDSVANLRVANANLEATAERIRAAQVAFDGIREEATLGARTTLDVLTAEQDLLDAQTAEISAVADQYVAAYQVLQSQGLLTAERMGLGVTIYDPEAYYTLTKDAPNRYSKQGEELDRVLKALGK